MDPKVEDCCSIAWTLGESSPFQIGYPVKGKESFGKLYSRRPCLSLLCPGKKRSFIWQGNSAHRWPFLLLFLSRSFFGLFLFCYCPVMSLFIPPDYLLALKCFL